VIFYDFTNVYRVNSNLLFPSLLNRFDLLNITQENKLVRLLSGSPTYKRDVIIKYGGDVKISFTSDDTITDQGFLATYTIESEQVRRYMFLLATVYDQANSQN